MMSSILAAPASAPRLAVPDDVNAFWYTCKGTSRALVFVHGILSDSRTCWLAMGADGQPSTYWPDLVLEDRRVEPYDIFMAGYTTAVDAGDLDIKAAAREVLDALEVPDRVGHQPPVDCPKLVFICHSTGGLVVRYMLERYAPQFADKAVGLVLLASPSRGSAWANVAGSLARYYNNQLARQLRLGDITVDDLDDRFRDVVYGERLPFLRGIEAYEHHFIGRRRLLGRILRVITSRLRIVSGRSAGVYFGAPRLVPHTDHFSIAKPTGLDHGSHRLLVRFLGEFDKFLSKKGWPAPVPIPADPVKKATSREIYESLNRLDEAAQRLTSPFAVEEAHRRVVIRPPDAELIVHERLLNASADVVDDIERVVDTDSPTEFKNLEFEAHARIVNDEFPLEPRPTASPDRRTFGVRMRFQGRVVRPGERLELWWNCVLPASVGRDDDYWVFPNPPSYRTGKLIAEAEFPTRPAEVSFFLFAKGGRQPASLTSTPTETGGCVYRGEVNLPAGHYVLTWSR